jgi:hypothetical protein
VAARSNGPLKKMACHKKRSKTIWSKSQALKNVELLKLKNQKSVNKAKFWRLVYKRDDKISDSNYYTIFLKKSF